MSKTEKLIEKLKRGSIDGNDLVTLLGRLGWYMIRQKGSHQSWSNGKEILILIADRVALKPYQIAEARKVLLLEKK